VDARAGGRVSRGGEGCAHWGHVDNALHGTCRQPHGGRGWGAACLSRLPLRALLLLLLLGRLVAAALLPLVRLELLLEMVEVEVLLLLAVQPVAVEVLLLLALAYILRVTRRAAAPADGRRARRRVLGEGG